MLGKASRQSRDTTINPDLPKLGPNSSDNSSISSFDRGNPLPGSIPSPELNPTPPPIPEITPQKTVKPTLTQKPEPKPIEKSPAMEKIIPDLPELDIENDLANMLTVPKKPKEIKKAKKYDKTEVPGITSSDKISKINEKTAQKPEVKIKPQTTPVQPRKKQLKTPKENYYQKNSCKKNQ